MKLAFRLVILAAVICLGAAAGAADAPGDDAPYAPPEFLAELPALPPGYNETQVLRLDLPQALMIAMQHNLGLSLERKSLQSSELSASAASAEMYEPTVTASVRHDGTTSTDSWDVSANQKLPTGATLSLGLTSSRGPSSLGIPVGAPGYSSGLSLSLTQPLLRGFSTDLAIPQYSLLTAKIASEQERHQLQISAATLVEQTESAYWEVVAALYAYGVTAKSLQLATDMMEVTRRQIAVGMVPSSDLTGAQNTVAQRKVALLSAAASVEQSWDALRTVLNLPRDQWDRPLLPTERPRFESTIVTSPEVALQTALHRRPEIAQAALDLESSTLALRKAENDRLPQIDLGLTGSVSGQGNSYRDALSGFGGRDAPGWGAMVTLTWTPLSRASKTNVELARIQREVRATNREQRVQAIWNEVRSAVRNQRAAALQVVAASQSRKLAAQSLEIEVSKYKTGTSSNLNVATLQNGLASAELSELQSLLGHERAAASLLLATGQLLEHRHISLELAAKR